MRPYRIVQSEEKPEVTRELIFRVFSYLSPYKRTMILSMVAILGVAVLGLAPPLLLQQMIDVAFPEKSFVYLVQLVALSFGSTLVLNLLTTYQTYLSTNISKDITFDLKNQMYQHLEYMSLGFYATEKSGEIVTRITSDIDGVSDIYYTTVVTLLTAIFTLSTTVITLLAMNPLLAFVAICTIPLFVIPTRRVGKIRWNITKKRQQRASQLQSHIQETLGISGSTLMKIFTTEKEEYDKFYQKNKEVVDLEKREMLTGRWYRMTLSLLSNAGPLIVYLAGGWLYMKGQLTVGMILTFAGLLSRLYSPVMQLANLHIDTTNSLALFQRIFEYLDRPQKITDTPQAQDQVITQGHVTFEHVSFRYDLGADLLTDLSFTAQSGEITALVGPSGAGKTTITSLLPRLYDIQKGKIAIDGIDIQDFTLSSLRRQIGIVTQEPYLFNGTIRENILYGNPTATEESMVAAAKLAYIHDFVMNLGGGYDTLVGNRGMKLSGGEKQRISIARVLLKNPPILILDEATSALDSVSEKHVQHAMVPLLKDRTSIVIAHRLSTIQDAEQILVIKKGKLVEIGTHDSLLEEKGLYATMYLRQFREQELFGNEIDDQPEG